MKKCLIVIFCCVSTVAFAQYSAMSLEKLDSMILHFYTRQEFEKALECTQISVEKSKGIDSSYAMHLGLLALMHKQLGQYDKAMPIYLKAIDVYSKAYGKQGSDYANLLNNLGSLHQEMGNYDAAIPLFSDAAKIWAVTYGENHLDYASVLNNLAYLHLSLGNYDNAESLFLKSKEIRKNNLGEKHEVYAQSLVNLGLVYYRTGDYEDAESFYLQALEIYKKTIGEQNPTYALALNNLAALYQKLQRYEAAEPLFAQAVEITKNTLGEKHPEYAGALNNLGAIYYKMGNYVENEKLLLKTLEIDKLVYGEKHPHYALSINNLATLYTAIGSYEKAEKLYTQSLEIWKNRPNHHHPDYSLTLNNMARLYLKINNYALAKNYIYQTILSNCKDKSLDSNQIKQNLFVLIEKDFYEVQNTIESLEILYEVYKSEHKISVSKQHLANAYIALQVCMKINENLRNSLSTDEDKLYILQQTSGFVAKAIPAGIELSNLEKEKAYLQEIFTYAEQNKSVLLADATKAQRARVFGDLPDSLAQYEIALQQKKKFLEKKEAEAKSEDDISNVRNELNLLNVEIKNFKKTLESKYNKYYKLKYNNITATVPEVQKLLNAQTAFLEYFVTDSVVYLFVLTKNDLKLFSFEVNKIVLEQQISDLRKSLSDYKYIKNSEQESFQKYTKSAYWFYKELLAAALKDVQNISNLIIVADGKLGHLPFEAFLTEAIQTTKSYSELPYLLHQYKISYNYSATLLVDNQQQVKGGKGSKSNQILAIAADYTNIAKMPNNRILRLRKLRESLHDIPAVKEEVLALSEQFDGCFLQGVASNEADFKKNAGEYGVIHLAMHGLLSPRAPILSSLAFTENGDSLQDNFLEAYEIAHLQLNAELVVLSACETGYGKFQQGEGILSLARSFMYAGVPSLVVSLWQVNDNSTAAVMENFYKYLAEGMPKDMALRQAKLDYINVAQGLAAHPAFWSPFIQLGDNQPIKLNKKSGWLWWLVGGAVVVLGSGAFAMRSFSKQ